MSDLEGGWLGSVVVVVRASVCTLSCARSADSIKRSKVRDWK